MWYYYFYVLLQLLLSSRLYDTRFPYATLYRSELLSLRDIASRSGPPVARDMKGGLAVEERQSGQSVRGRSAEHPPQRFFRLRHPRSGRQAEDRKSTRLNSSH